MNAPSHPRPSNNTPDEKKPQIKESTNRRSTIVSPGPEVPFPPPQMTPQQTKAEVVMKGPERKVDGVAIEGLAMVGQTSATPNGVKGTESSDSVDDDQSHLSSSSTKQQSFETKSMASVTTFAMDEKESIRPDDSASVRAADDEDAGSTLSRNATFHQESSVIMPSLRGGAGLNGPAIMIAARRYPTLTNPPRFGDLEATPVPLSDVSETPSSSGALDQHEEPSVRVPPPASPDEKLLDALASPKDRLSILQLEEKLLMFMGQSAADFIDLPPQNSYARLLAHKLADYYSLLHRINEDGMSIRIFQTSTSNLPPPLTVLAQSIPVGSSQSLPNAVKIMRRAGIGPRQFSTTESIAPSSSAPSKATSEAGHSEEGMISPMEGTPSRDKSKMTREEREAQYKAARERIFGDFQELSVSENVSTGENSASMSRSSSSSGKKKTRKQKAPKDDTFEARSAFVASYGPMHVQSMQTQYQQPQSVDHTYQSPYESSPASYNPQTNYGSTPTQAFPSFSQNIQMNSPVNFSPMSPQNYNMLETWPNMQPQPANNYFNYPQTQGGYQQNMPPMMLQMNNQYMQQLPPNMQQSSGWANSQFQNPYQAQMNPAQIPTNWPNYQQPQYGQLPNQFPVNSPVSPHGNIPNNFNRSLFNPQTRSFIPSTAGSRTAPRNTRKKNPLNPPQTRNSNGTKSYTSSNASTAAMLPHKGPAQDLSHSNSSSSSPKPNEESLHRKYGAPPNLPKKPPPSQAPFSFDAGSISIVKPPSASLTVNGNVSSVGGAGVGTTSIEAQDPTPSS
jgi:SUZ domain